MGKILIIDDDRTFCSLMSSVVKKMDHEVVTASTISEGVEIEKKNEIDIVLLDVDLPDGNGLELLPRLRNKPNPPEVIIITGSGDPDGAELAISTGAWDYIEKTSSIKQMMLPIIRAIDYRENKKSGAVRMIFDRSGIVGESRVISTCLDQMAQAAGSDASVLVTGETGTGKELFSRAIHVNSARSERRFVTVDCAALPETLVESVLFGHKRGAFTSAHENQIGLVELADGGTLFMDEAGELSLKVQKVFLRVLQERRFRPVGAQNELSSDFRLIAATNRNLTEMAAIGRFRHDLLFRLNTLSLQLPVLRDNTTDIKALTLNNVHKICEKHNYATKGISDEYLDLLYSYKWPGNVRELISAVESSIVVAAGDATLLPIHLPIHIRIQSARSSLKNTGPTRTSTKNENTVRPAIESFKTVINSTEKNYFQNLISAVDGDINKACSVSELSRSRLYALLKKHAIQRRF